jgi:multicomponent Na+:H+ antiporter subunit B
MTRWLIITMLAVLAMIMIAAVVELPRPGAPDAPVHTHVSAWYIDGGVEAGGAENLVAAVLLNYRALDTFGEVVVIFAALIAVLGVATVGPDQRATRGKQAGRGVDPIPISPVVSYMVRLLAPFIAAFALFVIVRGHLLPGGGFQGGAVFGTMLILLALFGQRSPPESRQSAPILPWLQVTGPLVFGLTALAGIVFAGSAFGLPGQHLWREAMMICLELGIAVGGAAVLYGLFKALQGD